MIQRRRFWQAPAMRRGGRPHSRSWPARRPAMPGEGRPRSRTWPRVPVVPREARTPQDIPLPPINQPPPICGANSSLSRFGNHWSCRCNRGFVYSSQGCVPLVCPPHSNPWGSGCRCDAGYVAEGNQETLACVTCPQNSTWFGSLRGNSCLCNSGYTSETTPTGQTCVLQPPPCPLPQCPEGGGDGGSVPNGPAHPRAR